MSNWRSTQTLERVIFSRNPGVGSCSRSMSQTEHKMEAKPGPGGEKR